MCALFVDLPPLITFYAPFFLFGTEVCFADRAQNNRWVTLVRAKAGAVSWSRPP